MKPFLILGAVVAFVVALWSGAWLVAAGMIRGEVESLALADGVTNPRIECADSIVAGYPFRFDVTCTGGTLTSGDTQIAVNELRASVRVYRPTHAQIFVHSPASISDAFTGSRRELRWDDLQASIRLDGWRLARASVTGDNLGFYDTLAGEALIASARTGQFHLLDIPERYDAEQNTQDLALYEELSGITLPATDILDGLWETQAEIVALPADIRQWSDPAILRLWQAGDGVLELVSLHASDDRRTLEADGDLHLDDDGRLGGTLSVTSNGLADDIGPLLPEAYRSILFAEPDEDGSYRQSIRFIGGIAMAGFLPLGAVPPLF
jgi:hypothetical protein